MEDGPPGFQFRIDAKGLVVLEGLSADETFEYEMLAHQCDHLRNSADQVRLNDLVEKHRLAVASHPPDVAAAKRADRHP